MGKIIFPREHTNWSSNSSPASIQVTLHRLRRLYLYTWGHAHTTIKAIEEKEVMTFKENRGWGTWRKEAKGGNCEVIISKIKNHFKNLQLKVLCKIADGISLG